MAFPGRGKSQVKEEGTAHNSGLCKTAVAPNLCQPFQTDVSQNSRGVGAPFSASSSKPLQAVCLLCPRSPEQSCWAPSIPAQGLFCLVGPRHSLGPKFFGPGQMWRLLRERSQQLSHARCQGHLGPEPLGS